MFSSSELPIHVPCLSIGFVLQLLLWILGVLCIGKQPALCSCSMTEKAARFKVSRNCSSRVSPGKAPHAGARRQLRGRAVALRVPAARELGWSCGSRPASTHTGQWAGFQGAPSAVLPVPRVGCPPHNGLWQGSVEPCTRHMGLLPKVTLCKMNPVIKDHRHMFQGC